MKKTIYIPGMVLLFALLVVPFESKAGVRIAVRIGPPPVKFVRVLRPARPWRNAIWVKGHYVYRRGRYIHRKGHWVRPRARHYYIQPHWKRGRRGFIFVPGHWVRIR